MKRIEKIFKEIDTEAVWSIKLLTVKSSTREGVIYSAHQVLLDPLDTLEKHVLELKKKYLEDSNAILKKYTKVVDYDGSAESTYVYKIERNSELINREQKLLFDALDRANQEGNPFEQKYSAYVISGISDGKPVHFFTMQSPFVNMKRKHWWDGKKFVEMTTPVLALRMSADVIFYDNSAYLMTMAGENLFQLERAYKKVSSFCIKQVNESGILADIDTFESVASSGNNPRKFVSYNKAYLEKLNNKKTREKMGRKFDIPLKDGKFDTTDKNTSEKVIKLLCKKGMLDPFEDSPVEVSSAIAWS